MFNEVSSLVNERRLEELENIAFDYLDAGDALREIGDLASAKEKYEKAAALFSKLLDRRSNKLLSLRGAAFANERLGYVFYDRHDYQMAIQIHRSAAAQYEQLRKDANAESIGRVGRLRLMIEHANIYGHIAKSEYKIENYANALTYHKKSIEILKEVIDNDENNSDANIALLLHSANVGFMHYFLGEQSEAFHWMNIAKSDFEKIRSLPNFETDISEREDYIKMGEVIINITNLIDSN